ncbi:MAG: M28 family peptidase [Bacteroidetes bacterium]|nr:M28 family peptidase [Rhodothermia bacterium]MCS7154336.1 M28 family peptidase [Bacteroidota bacterium]MCX7906627.1 M28 family peptidase [Bacteroidota bacterium]MDW8137092.1 M28 family peptidase [Bacteroidota bacterium]MDW8285037.1 M28 family peptidase [Bacteroidota bacterium]
MSCMVQVLLSCLLVSLGLPLWAQPERELAYARAVEEARLALTVRDLVRFGHRLGGSPSNEQSAAYLLGAFRAMGLEAELRLDPPRWTWWFDTFAVRLLAPQERALSHPWPAPYSPSAGPLRAPVLLFRPDVRREHVQGRIVLIDGLDRRNAALYDTLARWGAVALLTDAPRWENAYSDWAFISSLPARPQNPIPMVCLSRNDGAWIRERLARGEPVELFLMLRSHIAWRRPWTVLASLPGQRPDYYLVCAHGDGDAGGPGADDNASGVAGVLEIARVLSEQVRAGTLPQPLYGMRFAVWGSEYFSTEAFVRAEAEAGRLGRIRGVFNFDQIGTGAEKQALYFESNDVPYNETLLRTLESIGRAYAGRAGFWPQAYTNPSQGGTDSYVFLHDYLRDRLRIPGADTIRIPATTVYTAAWNRLARLPQTPGWGPPDTVEIDYSRYYHSSLDVPELTTDREPFRMAWAARAVGIALLRLAWGAQQEAPRYRRR